MVLIHSALQLGFNEDAVVTILTVIQDHVCQLDVVLQFLAYGLTPTYHTTFATMKSKITEPSDPIIVDFHQSCLHHYKQFIGLKSDEMEATIHNVLMTQLHIWTNMLVKILTLT